MEKLSCRVTAVALLAMLGVAACRPEARKDVVWLSPSPPPLWYANFDRWLEQNPSMRGKILIGTGDASSESEARRRAREEAAADIPPGARTSIGLLDDFTRRYEDGSYTVAILFEYSRPAAAEGLQEGARKLCNALLEKIPPSKRAKHLTVAVGKFYYKNTRLSSEFSELIRSTMQAALQARLSEVASSRQKLLNKLNDHTPLDMEVIDGGEAGSRADALVTGSFWPWADGRSVLVEASIKELSTGTVLGGALTNISIEHLAIRVQPGKEPVGPDEPKQMAHPERPLRPHRLNVFLTRDFVPRNTDSEVTLAAVIARRDVISRGDIKISSILAKQTRRLNGFIAELQAGYSDELRKRMNAWAECICAFATKCQGGSDPCKGCSTCADMPHAMGMPGMHTMTMMRGTATICPPKNICLVIDVSSSMRGEKLEQVKSAAKESLRHYMKGDVFSLVTFADYPERLIAPTEISETVPGLMMCESVERFIEQAGKKENAPGVTVLQAFISKIDSMTADGLTDVFEALKKAQTTMQATSAQRSLLGNPRAINRILLFSDGKHDDLEADARTLGKFRRLAEKIAADGMSISTFGVGRTDFDEKLMNEMVKPSLKHSGSYYYVRDVRTVYDLMWNDLMLVPVAKDAKVYVDVAPEIEADPLGPLVYRNKRNPRMFTGNIKSLAWDNKRTITIKFRIPRSASGGARSRIKLADVRFEYLDADGVERKERAEAYVRIGPPAPPTAKNRIATEEAIIQEARDALSEALAAGSARKAGRILEQQVTRFERWNY